MRIGERLDLLLDIFEVWLTVIYHILCLLLQLSVLVLVLFKLVESFIAYFFQFSFVLDVDVSLDIDPFIGSGSLSLTNWVTSISSNNLYPWTYCLTLMLLLLSVGRRSLWRGLFYSRFFTFDRCLINDGFGIFSGCPFNLNRISKSLIQFRVISWIVPLGLPGLGWREDIQTLDTRFHRWRLSRLILLELLLRLLRNKLLSWIISLIDSWLLTI